MSKYLLIIIIFFIESCSCEMNMYECDYSYFNSYNYDDFYKKNSINYYNDICDSTYYHTIKLNFTFFNIKINKPEILCFSRSHLYYRGKKKEDITSYKLESCVDSSDLSVIRIILLDHEKEKAFEFFNKQSYFSNTLNDERFLLFPDGTYKMVHNNWFWNTFF